VDDLDVGEGGEDLMEDGDEMLIEFDGYYPPGVKRKLSGETAQPGADFQDIVRAPYPACIDNFLQSIGVHEEVLTEAFFRVEVVLAQQGRHIEGREGAIHWEGFYQNAIVPPTKSDSHRRTRFA